MASLQAHLLDLLVRLQVKRKLVGQTDLAAVRKILQGDGRPSLPLPRDVEFAPAMAGSVAGEWVRPTAVAPKAVMLFLHGGGYFACSPRTHRPLTAAFARLGFSVFVPEYRLAPEHQFPAAIEDAQAAWHWLVAQGHPAQTLTVSGDSAGGGLALALMVSLRDQRLALPAAAALFSPWTDLAGTGPSVISNAVREAMFWAPGLVHAGSFYLGAADPRTRLASPFYADLAGLPPLLIHVGDREILRDDSTRLAARARKAGVDVELRVWGVVPHVWQFAQFVPEARESVGRAASFLQVHAAEAAPLQAA